MTAFRGGTFDFQNLICLEHSALGCLSRQIRTFKSTALATKTLYLVDYSSEAASAFSASAFFAGFFHFSEPTWMMRTRVSCWRWPRSFL